MQTDQQVTQSLSQCRRYLVLSISYSRDTLRFFGQTMSSFKTEWYDKDKGIVRVYAPMRDHTGERMGTTERFVDINDSYGG